MKLDDDEAEAETTKKSCPSQASTVGAAKGKTKSRKRKRAPILCSCLGSIRVLAEKSHYTCQESGDVTFYLYFFGALQTPTKRTRDDKLNIIDVKHMIERHDM